MPGLYSTKDIRRISRQKSEKLQQNQGGLYSEYYMTCGAGRGNSKGVINRSKLDKIKRQHESLQKSNIESNNNTTTLDDMNITNMVDSENRSEVVEISVRIVEGCTDNDLIRMKMHYGAQVFENEVLCCGSNDQNLATNNQCYFTIKKLKQVISFV